MLTSKVLVQRRPTKMILSAKLLLLRDNLCLLPTPTTPGTKEKLPIVEPRITASEFHGHMTSDNKKLLYAACVRGILLLFLVPILNRQ